MKVEAKKPTAKKPATAKKVEAPKGMVRLSEYATAKKKVEELTQGQIELPEFVDEGKKGSYLVAVINALDKPREFKYEFKLDIISFNESTFRTYNLKTNRVRHGAHEILVHKPA